MTPIEQSYAKENGPDRDGERHEPGPFKFVKPSDRQPDTSVVRERQYRKR